MSLTEHDEEPVRGLPERPPEGENLLWQGAPDWRALARHALHTRKVSAYFLILGLWSFWADWSRGDGLAVSLGGIVWLPFVWAAAIGVLWLIAWAMAKSTVYTITTKRIVIRFGAAIEKAVNIPFSKIDGVSLRRRERDLGDVAVRTVEGARVGFFMIWPHARPFRLKRPEPMLRCVPEGERVAEILTRAIRASGEDVILGDAVQGARGRKDAPAHDDPLASPAE